MVNYRRRRGQAAKLQLKFVGPYAAVEVMPKHMYKIERTGQVFIQNEARLKPYWASRDAVGEAPPSLEPHRIDKGNLLLLAAMLMVHCNYI